MTKHELGKSFVPDIGDEGMSWQSLLIFTGCALGTVAVVVIIGAIIF